MSTSSTYIVIVVIVILIVLVVYLRINRARIIGAWGEKKVSFVLSMLGEEYKIFNDVMISTKYGSSQVDHIVVSPYGIFVLETKNYKGRIFGGKYSDHWTQNIWGHKYDLPNPIRQNEGHIKALQKSLPFYNENQYISLVVFTHKSKLIIHARDKFNVIHTWKLIHRIHSFKEIILTEDQQNEYIQELQKFLVITKDQQRQHKKQVKQSIDRNKKAIKCGICPCCGGVLIKRRGKHGSFYGCSNYPQCNYILNI